MEKYHTVEILSFTLSSGRMRDIITSYIYIFMFLGPFGTKIYVYVRCLRWGGGGCIGPKCSILAVGGHVLRLVARVWPRGFVIN